MRWIGPADSEEPAARVKLTSGNETATTPAARSSSKDDDASKGLGIAALVVGAVGLLVGAVALAASRRRRT